MIILCSVFSNAQQSGNTVFQSLNLTPSAKLAALGGEQITSLNADINYATVNPALLQPSLHNTFALNFVNYFADVSYNNFSYVRHLDGYGTVSASVNYLNYGTFTRTDAAGFIQGEFKAFDYSIQVGASKFLDSIIFIGVNLKYVQSQLDDLKSNGMAFDMAATYYSPNELFSAAALIKNAGIQFSKFTGDRVRLPLNIQVGLTKRLAHAPFRFSLLLHNLQNPDLSFENANLITTDPITEEVSMPNVSLGEKLMQHTVWGIEFIPSKVFNVRLGYNYRRRHDLKITDRVGTTGFSWGIGLKIATFKLDYGRATYHLSGASNFISISITLNQN